MSLILAENPIPRPQPAGKLDEFTKQVLAEADPPVTYDPAFTGPDAFEQHVLKHESEFPVATDVHRRLVMDGKINDAGTPINGWSPQKAGAAA